MNRTAVSDAAVWFLRLALAVGFLSAVGDRFGLWGPPGAAGVAWGAWSPFLAYVAALNPWAPGAFVPLLGWAATLGEIGCALALLTGWRLRHAAFASGLLLTAFALAMTFTEGIKSPLDCSVYTAAAGAFLLAARGGEPTS